MVGGPAHVLQPVRVAHFVRDCWATSSRDQYDHATQNDRKEELCERGAQPQLVPPTPPPHQPTPLLVTKTPISPQRCGQSGPWEPPPHRKQANDCSTPAAFISTVADRTPSVAA